MRSIAISCPRWWEVCSQTPGHHPGTGALHIEKGRAAFPPGFVFRLKYGEALAGVFGVALDELEASLLLGQRRSGNVDAEHGAKPQIFTHTLMHHLLMHAAAAGVAGAGANRQVSVAELAPDAEDFYPLGGVGFDQEVVAHRAPRDQC